MTMEEYHSVIGIINGSIYERQIYLEIERQVQAKGHQVPDISYADYMLFRNYLDAMYRVPYVQAVNSEVQSSVRSQFANPEMPRKRKEIITWDCASKGTGKFCLWATGILALIGLLLPTGAKEIFLLLAAVFLYFAIIGFLPARSVNSEHADMYFRTNEEARIRTEAYLRQAYMHKEQISFLYKQLNK